MGLFDKLRNKGDKKITKEEFIKRVREDEDYAPGWEAIEGALKLFTKIKNLRTLAHSLQVERFLVVMNIQMDIQYMILLTDINTLSHLV